jgi:hypothetical protein
MGGYFEVEADVSDMFAVGERNVLDPGVENVASERGAHVRSLWVLCLRRFPLFNLGGSCVQTVYPGRNPCGRPGSPRSPGGGPPLGHAGPDRVLFSQKILT